MEISPPIMAFRHDLIGSRLASWNELLQRIASVQLMHGSNEFLWGLIKKVVFSVSSMYKALFKPFQSVLNNKSILKMKIPLKTNVFLLGISGVVLFLLMITLENVCFFSWKRYNKTFFFSIGLLGLYDQSFSYVLPYIRHEALQYFWQFAKRSGF
jgi:hypothetical protein